MSTLLIHTVHLLWLHTYILYTQTFGTCNDERPWVHAATIWYTKYHYIMILHQFILCIGNIMTTEYIPLHYINFHDTTQHNTHKYRHFYRYQTMPNHAYRKIISHPYLHLSSFTRQMWSVSTCNCDPCSNASICSASICIRAGFWMFLQTDTLRHTLVGGLERMMNFPKILDISSSQLTNSNLFQRGFSWNHQPEYIDYP